MAAGSSNGQDIIGREAERAVLARFIESGPHPGALLIEGEAGIGKTTLWQVCLGAALERGDLVLSTRASPSETRLSYLGLRDLLEPVVEDRLDSLPEPQRLALDAAILRRGGQGRRPEPRTVAVAFLAVLRLVAVDRSVVLAIDDAQWLDPASSRVIGFAMRRLDREPVALVSAIRLGIAPQDPLGLEAPGATVPLERLSVGPLDPVATDRLIRARLASNLSRRLLLKVHATAAGNPFFALELARAMAGRDTPLAPGEPLPLPHQLRELPAAALRRLTPATRDVLLLAALAPRPTLSLLSRVAGPAYLRAVDEAVDAGLLQLRGGPVAFSHPLIAAAVEESAPRRRFRAAHRRLARVADDPEQRAAHLSLSIVRPDRGVARLLDDAASHARSRGAPEAAAALLLRAAELTPDDSPSQQAARRIAAAACRFELGESGPARDDLELLIRSVPRGLQRAEALRVLALIDIHGGSVREAIGLLRQAIAEATGDDRLRGAAEVALAVASLWSGDAAGAVTHGRAAAEVLERAEEPGLLAAGLSIAATAEFLMGQPISAPPERALLLETSAEPMPVEWRPSFLQAYIEKLRGEISPARERFQVVLRQLHHLGDEASLPVLLSELAELETWAGDLQRAREHADAAALAAVRTAQDMDRAVTLFARGLVDARAGRLDAARQAGEEALALASASGLLLAVELSTSLLGFIALSVEDYRAVDERLGPLADSLRRAGIVEPSVLRFIPDEIEALVALGELERAERLLGPFEARARALDRVWARAVAARCRGLLAAALGDLSSGLRSLEVATARAAALEMPFEAGRTLLVKGRIERRAKQWRAARRSLEEASARFAAAGTPRWETMAQGELRRVGGRPQSPMSLTETERRVATLIAAGNTTRQAAEALFVTPRAVESSLGRVYQKLGIRSRAELGGRITTSSPAGR